MKSLNVVAYLDSAGVLIFTNRGRVERGEGVKGKLNMQKERNYTAGSLWLNFTLYLNPHIAVNIKWIYYNWIPYLYLLILISYTRMHWYIGLSTFQCVFTSSVVITQSSFW